MDHGAAFTQRWFLVVGGGSMLLWLFLMALAYSRACQAHIYANAPSASKMVGAYWAESSCAYMVTAGLFGGATSMQVLLYWILQVVLLLQHASAELPKRAHQCCTRRCAMGTADLAFLAQALVIGQSCAMMLLLVFPVYSVKHADERSSALRGSSTFDGVHFSAAAVYIGLLISSVWITNLCLRATPGLAERGSGGRRLLDASLTLCPGGSLITCAMLLASRPADGVVTPEYEASVPHFEALAMLQIAAAVSALAVVCSRSGASIRVVRRAAE
jgi:hypothetical protein